ncbi:MAG: YciI family protein [Acidobacteria bacterium]|nr:YciI family protein [Acidobacteriota bacterium]
MYALAIIRYRRPLDEVRAHHAAHRAYLQSLKAQGLLVASGPLEPRSGGALLLRVPEDAVEATLDKIRDGDPYWKAGVGQYELLAWNVHTGREDLDRA